VAPPAQFPTSRWLDAVLPPPASEGVTRGGGRGAAGSPCGRPLTHTYTHTHTHTHTHSHTHTRSAARAVTDHPWPLGGGAEIHAARQPARDLPAGLAGSPSRHCHRRQPAAPAEGPAGGPATAAGGGRVPAAPSARFGAAASPPPAG
jgi:hypothetical protein